MSTLETSEGQQQFDGNAYIVILSVRNFTSCNSILTPIVTTIAFRRCYKFIEVFGLTFSGQNEMNRWSRGFSTNFKMISLLSYLDIKMEKCPICKKRGII